MVSVLAMLLVFFSRLNGVLAILMVFQPSRWCFSHIDGFSAIRVVF
jgi:hypothetical protein